MGRRAGGRSVRVGLAGAVVDEASLELRPEQLVRLLAAQDAVELGVLVADLGQDLRGGGLCGEVLDPAWKDQKLGPFSCGGQEAGMWRNASVARWREIPVRGRAWGLGRGTSPPAPVGGLHGGPHVGLPREIQSPQKTLPKPLARLIPTSFRMLVFCSFRRRMSATLPSGGSLPSDGSVADILTGLCRRHRTNIGPTWMRSAGLFWHTPEIPERKN